VKLKINKMKKPPIAFAAGFLASGLLAFTMSNTYEIKTNTAEVDQVQGYYIFAKCRPVKDYEHLGTVKGPLIGNHQFDNLVELMIKKAKKDYSDANALIFDGSIRQTHNTKVSAVKIKE
jgi:hypothetical protein